MNEGYLKEVNRKLPLSLWMEFDSVSAFQFLHSILSRGNRVEFQPYAPHDIERDFAGLLQGKYAVPQMGSPDLHAQHFPGKHHRQAVSIFATDE